MPPGRHEPASPLTLAYLLVDSSAMETRDAILDAAQGLIQARGANGMSYEDISQAVGIRKASIHYHFSSKAVLVEALIGRYSQRFAEAVEDILASDAPAAALLDRFFGLFRQTLESGDGKICLCGMLASEAASLEDGSRLHVKRFFDHSSASLGAILRRGGQDGSLRSFGDSSAAAAMAFSALEGALLAARLEEPAAERFDQLTAPLRQLLVAT